MNECKYCNQESRHCEYWKDSLDGEWYQDIETSEWSDWDDGYVHQHNYGVKYCQYCGKKLSNN